MKKPANTKPRSSVPIMFVIFTLVVNASIFGLIAYNFHLMEDATNEFTHSIYMLNCTIAYIGLMLSNIKLASEIE
tara:strand:- start:1424 stop:1648 length:225 start_codon:yes stop_codon:yes gene_type:complete